MRTVPLQGPRPGVRAAVPDIGFPVDVSGDQAPAGRLPLPARWSSPTAIPANAKISPIGSENAQTWHGRLCQSEQMITKAVS
ncbi:hypothetical protein GCM10020216_034790 [Nonomuraea helvata]